MNGTDDLSHLTTQQYFEDATATASGIDQSVLSRFVGADCRCSVGSIPFVIRAEHVPEFRHPRMFRRSVGFRLDPKSPHRGARAPDRVRRGGIGECRLDVARDARARLHRWPACDSGYRVHGDRLEGTLRPRLARRSLCHIREPCILA